MASRPQMILPNVKDANKLDILMKCPVCQQTNTITVDHRAFAQWRGGAHIQDVMPELSASQREILITGIDGACWSRMFS